MKKFLSWSLAVTSAAGVALSVRSATYDAATNYVNCKLGDYSGHNGSTPELAFETIQQAVDNAVDNSTIVVYPGDYNKGLGRGESSNHWWGPSRIHIGAKNLYIKSVGGATATHIVGGLGPKEQGYYGDHNTWSGKTHADANYARCIDIAIDPGDARQIVIEGFTLRDGATTAYRDDCPCNGGAIMCTDGSVATHGCTFVDCVISNCYGHGNTIYGGSLVRCLIAENNMMPRPGAASSVRTKLIYASRLINCLVSDNYKKNADGTLDTVNVQFAGSPKVVNTSFVNNRMGLYNTGGEWYNTIMSLMDKQNDSATYTHNVIDSRTDRVLMSPATGDVRVRKGSKAENAGDAKWLADTDIFPLPAIVDRFKDYYGNDIPNTGAINVGCSQSTVEPVGGCILAKNTDVSMDGKPYVHYGHAPYAYTDSYPKSFRLVAADYGEKKKIRNFVYGSYFTDVVGIKTDRIPNIKGELWAIPPPDDGGVLDVSVNYETNFKYADPNANPEVVADGSNEKPYPTLQAAIEACHDDFTSGHETGMVLAKPGVYKDGYGENGMKARIYLDSWNILVKGIEGPEKTIVMGAPDPSTGGIGDGATLLVSMKSSAAVQGLTLTGGYSGTGDWSSNTGRGAIYSYGNDLMIADCIITNNYGKNCSVGTAYFERCLIADNHGASGVTIDGKHLSCVIANNTLSNARALFLDDWDAYSTWLLSCTLVGDGAHGIWRHSSANTTDFIVNSTVDRASGTAKVAGSVVGSVLNGFSDHVEGALSADPCLSDAEAGDVRLFSLSPARSSGSAPNMVRADKFWWYACSMDYRGEPWQFNADGCPASGAVQEIVSGGAYVVASNGGLSVGGGKKGLNQLGQGDSLTFGFTSGATRPLAGVIVNGVTNRFDTSHVTVPFTMGNEDVLIVALYSNDWFVDAVHGNDDAWGYNEACCFKTLKRAMENELLLSNDRVIALPGCYREKTMTVPGCEIPARAVVPNKVTLESRDGAAVTFIEGLMSDVSDRSTNEDHNKYIEGMGKNAIRGVYLKGEAVGDRSIVRGFTITNCYVRGATDAGGGGHGNLDYCGAGVAGLGRAERCVFVDCHAFRGGGVYLTDSIDCTFHSNVALYGGGATSDARQYGSLSYDNTCAGNSTWCGFFSWKAVDGCTVADGLGGCANGTGYAMRNTLVTGYVGNWDQEPTGKWFTNCVVNVDKSARASYMSAIADGVGCIVTNVTVLQVDEGYRPIIGANVAIDRANESITENVSADDLSGVQRVYNGRRDVGALEADWRPVYANDIRRKLMSVQFASPTVTESESNTVVLNGDASLSGWFAGKVGMEYVFEVKITDGGALTMIFNGEPVSPCGVKDERIQYRIRQTVDSSSLAFDYDSKGGAGCAEVFRAMGCSGLILTVR